MWNLMSLDGLFEGARPWELDWHMYVWGDDLEQLSLDQLRGADVLLFGRFTYEGMAAYWPSATGEVAEAMNAIPKLVVSTTIERPSWHNTRVLRSRVTGELGRLKQQPGKDILVFGSAALCNTLLHAGLIDELRLGVVPVVLGSGTPLFKASAERRRMALLESKAMPSGCVILRYRPLAASPAGDVLAPTIPA